MNRNRRWFVCNTRVERRKKGRWLVEAHRAWRTRHLLELILGFNRDLAFQKLPKYSTLNTNVLTVQLKWIHPLIGCHARGTVECRYSNYAVCFEIRYKNAISWIKHTRPYKAISACGAICVVVVVGRSTEA